MGIMLCNQYRCYQYTLSDGDVDFLLEVEEGIKRVQVKAFYKNGNTKIVDLSKKGIEKHYKDDAFDVLMLVDTETLEVIWINAPISNKGGMSKRIALMNAYKIFTPEQDNTNYNLDIPLKLNSVTHTQPPKKHSSKYKGVGFSKSKNKWRARVYRLGKFKHIGYYDNEEDAARAYDKVALEIFGDDAYQNFNN